MWDLRDEHLFPNSDPQLQESSSDLFYSFTEEKHLKSFIQSDSY